MSGDEPAWVRIQKKTFTRWCNNYLQQRDTKVEDLQKDLKDGIALHTLLEILGNEEVIPKANRRAKLKLQMVENLNTCLRYIKAKNINLVNIGAEDIHDGKIKLILGLIWTLILRFQIMAEDEESAGARAALLEWCNSVLNPQGLYVKNFTGDWQDGRCFCGLVNAIEPNNIPLNTVPASEAEKNMNKAFTNAEQLFGFPQVLDAIDVIENPDDLSIMTYVSYFRAYMLANNAYGPNCTAEGPGLTEATTFEKAPFTITTYNEEGERVERGGAMVKVTLKDDAGAEVTKVNITDNRNGTYSCHYTAERPGKFTLEILVKKDNIKNSPFHPVVKPGEPSPPHCEAEGPGLTHAVAGEEAKFSVITKDIGGNRLPRGGANIKGSLKDPRGDIPVKVVDNGDGTYACSYVPITSGTSKLQVIVSTQFNGTGDIKNSPFSVAVSPAGPSGKNSIASGPGISKAVAGAENPFSIQARDRFDNDIKTGGAQVGGELVNNATGEKVPVRVADNNNGTYSCSYPDIKTAGTYTLVPTVAGEGVKDSPFTVTVTHADPSGDHFTWEGLDLDADGNQVVVAGTTEKFTVVSRDKFGNRISGGGLKVTGHISGGPADVKVHVADKNDGAYELDYTPIKTGKYAFQVNLDGKAIGGGKNPFGLVVIPADPYGPTSPASGASLSKAVAGEENPFSLQVRDKYENNLVKGGSQVAGTLTHSETGEVVNVKVHDNGDGTYKGTFADVKRAGTYKLVPTVTGEGVKDSPFTVSVSEAAADPAHFVWEGLNLDGEGNNVVVAGTTETFTVIARDRFDNRITTGGLSIRAAIAGGPANVTATVTDNKDGSYKVDYTPTKTGVYQLTVSLESTPIGGSKNPFQVVVIPADPYGPTSFASGSGLSKAVAGEDNPFEVQVRDKFENNLTQGGAQVAATLAGPNGVIVNAKVHDNGNGTYRLTYPDLAVAGTYKLVPTVTGEAVKDAPFTVSATESAADPKNFKWEGLNLDADGNNIVVAGTTEHFTVIAFDKFHNRITTGGLNVNGVVKGPAEVKVTVTDKQDGSYKLEYTPTKAEKYQFTVQLNETAIGGSKNPFELVVIPADAYGPTSIASGEGLSEAVAGEPNTFYIGSHDKFKNECVKGGAEAAATLTHKAEGDVVKADVEDEGDGTYVVSYPSIKKRGTYTLVPTIKGDGVKGSPFTVNVHSAEADAAAFTWDGPALDANGNQVVVAGTTEKFTVTARDRFGNQAEEGGLKVDGIISGGPADVQVSTKDNGDGTYTLEYTPVKAGQYQFAVQLDGTNIGGHKNPFGLLCIPNEPYGPTSVSSGEGLAKASVGGKNEFDLQTRDKYDNVVTKGGAKVGGQVAHKETGVVVPLTVKDNGDGTYKIGYPGVKAKGKWSIAPVVADEAVKDSPFEVYVAPGGFDNNNTVVEIPKPGHAGRRGPKVSVKDNEGNLREGFDDDVEADLTPKIKIPRVKARSNGDGTYEIDYPPNLLPGDYEIDIRVNGQNAPKSPFVGPVELKQLSPEHSQALQETVPEQAAVFNRLLLNATDSERESIIKTLQSLKK